MGPWRRGGAIAGERLEARQIIGNVEPGDALGIKRMPARHQNIRIVEGADMNLEDRPAPRAADALPGQWRSAFFAKRATNARRRLVNLACIATELDPIRHEPRQGNDRRAGVLAAAAAMAVDNGE